MDAALHLASDPDAAKAWLDAPMPGAAVCTLEVDTLTDPLGARQLRLGGDLTRRLSAVAGTHLAQDAQGALWRLRILGPAKGPQLWQLQSLAQSRFQLAALLRATLAQRLAGHVLHELRNPLNAVSLYTDVLGMLVPKAAQADAQDKAATALKSIKDRVQELNLRQQTSMVVWTGQEDVEPPVPVSTIWRDVTRLIGAHLTLKTIPLRGQGLEAVEQCGLMCPRPLLALAWISLLMMGADAAALHPEGAADRHVGLAARVSGGSLQIHHRGPLEPASLGAALGPVDSAVAAAALALLLHGGPATVATAAEGGMILSLALAPG
jgi:signal transduction histidine kinase